MKIFFFKLISFTTILMTNFLLPSDKLNDSTNINIELNRWYNVKVAKTKLRLNIEKKKRNN